ncbi:MAG TPA: helix-turn-helix transcriptional regulator [Ktedonobacteraceae bacterium]|jgi:DNA-binding CsgD family transcriptional regulator|nr:helix-turn-helix transcriptional regulator [Ktedonobacteraceae bacterium]
MTNSQLSGRETEVLQLVAQGRDDDDIAKILVLSANTVRAHLMNIRKKLGYKKCSHKEAGSIRVRLTIYALESGIVKLEGISMEKNYTPEEEQRIRELVQQIEMNFNAFGPMLEELFTIYEGYEEHHVKTLQLLLEAMNEVNFVEIQRGIKKKENSQDDRLC